MVTRRKILQQAIDDCMKELYSLVQPSVEWDDFVQQNKEYSKKFKEWEAIKENRPDIREFCGPKPYEMYYLPREVMKDVCDAYVSAYKMDEQQNLLDIIDILKKYCEQPIVDKYIESRTDENGFTHPGYRGYDHPKSLETVLGEMLESEEKGTEAWEKMKEYLDMAGNFYSWNSELNTFNCSVYLGASPNSNKDAVINNWKEYKGVDIEIDDDKYKEEEEDY